MKTIKENITAVQEKIEYFCDKAGVSETGVELIAVSKTQPAELIQEAYDAGLRMFGENKVQEFVQKRSILPKDVCWNLIGQLQTNKVKYIIDESVYLLHSLDRESLAAALQKQCESKNTSIDVLLQLNLSREQSKAGVLAEDLDGFLDTVCGLNRLRVRGMMTIGPNTDDEKSIRKVFAQAKTIFDKLAAQEKSVQYLSMGMSHDFGWAILEGSNMVRVGTAVFGQRNYAQA